MRPTNRRTVSRIGLLAAIAAACLCPADNARAAEPPASGEPPAFNCQTATMTLGRDGKVYMTCLVPKEPGGFVMRLDLDGRERVGGVLTTQVFNATANAQGFMATSNPHFARKVTLWDPGFNVVGAMVKISGFTFYAPIHVEAGPSGDFYAADNPADRIVRFTPDGMRVGTYAVPREPEGDSGVLRDFRVCEKHHTFYVLTSDPKRVIRCLSFDGPDWKITCRKLWSVETPVSWGERHLGGGSGGFDVDPDGVLYFKDNRGGPIKRYDPDGKPMEDLPLKFGPDQLPGPAESGFRYLSIVGKEAVLNRAHKTELFQRYDLATGQLKGVVSVGPVTPPTKGVAPSMPEPKPAPHAEGEPHPMRVLFVGNSQVNCVSDIAEIVEDLSHSAPASIPRIQADEVVIGGAGLEQLWNDGLARRKIEIGRYDVVVLQEMIGVAEGRKDSFVKHARLFGEAVQQAKSRTLFFVTAQVEGKKAAHEVMYKANQEMARELGCRLAGGGMAWLRAWAKDPKLDLHHTDRAHPNVKGYYLNACVIYAAMTDASSVGLDPFSLSKEDARFLQEIAWEQAREDRVQEKK